MASVTTGEFVKATGRNGTSLFSPIEQKGLIARLGEELARAVTDFARDPSGFIRDLFSDDSKDSKRSRRIRFGLACALAAHAVLLAVVIWVGWHAATRREESGKLVVKEWVRTGALTDKAETPDAPKTEAGKGTNGGGGGGGQRALTPVPKGVPPRSLPTLPVVKDVPAPNDPTLAVMPNITGFETPPPPPDAPSGLANGKGTEPSGGQGSGGGIGTGNGTGAGSGTGPGKGPGEGTGGGGGRSGSPDGAPGSIRTSFNHNEFNKEPDSTPFSWIRRPTPVVTPEAEAAKVSGEVLLRATLRSDGTIDDIQLVKAVPFMSESAIDALKRSKFRPATVKGVPVTLRNVIIRINVTVGRR